MCGWLAVRYGDGFIVYTDAAIFSADQRIVGVASHVRTLPTNPPCAVIARGTVGRVLDAFGELAAAAPAGFDGVVAKLSEIGQRRWPVEMCVFGSPAPDAAPVERMIRPESDEIQVWDDAIYTAPVVADYAFPATGFADADAIAWFQTVRRTDPYEFVGVPPRSASARAPERQVGGFIERTIVTATGVNIERIHEWPEDPR